MNKAKKKNKPSFKDFLDELKANAVTEPKKVERIEERKYFLIVTEGERTEPLYFEYFKNYLPKNFLETIKISGEGDNTLNIVRKAIELKSERNSSLRPAYDEVWAGFDKDNFPDSRFNEAVSLANQVGINSGHSNQSFELWYVLHFQYLTSALDRSDYIKLLSKKLGFKYEKNNPIVVEYLFKNCNIKQAISWAKQLESLHSEKTPAQSCPYTKVYILVEKLLAYCGL
ncbi:MAG: RloB domain-containing protein [Saprospiraceae bacterium]|nr:RloB domain-containing protein [Saprospiraceae bacterium]